LDQKTKSEEVGVNLIAAHGADDPFAAAVRATRMAMIVADAGQDDLPVVFANDAFLRLTGYDRHEVIGRNCRFLQGPETDPATVARIRDAVRAGRDIAVEILNYRKDGAPFWNALYLSPVRDEGGTIRYFFGSQLDVTDKKRAELELIERKDGLERAVGERTRDLRAALEQKTVLLNEVDHRVKNNLQLISSLVVLQLRRSQDPAVKTALQDVLGRVNAVATVHRRLFQGDDVARFDVSSFVRDLTDDLASQAAERGVAIELELEPVSVPASKAAPLSLVLHEIVGERLRDGFEGRGGGLLSLRVYRENGHYCIVVQDDGVFRARPATDPGAGRYIVDLLARQLKAELKWEQANPGTRVVISMPMNGATA
jgi:PAS domain S-box-containing protein